MNLSALERSLISFKDNDSLILPKVDQSIKPISNLLYDSQLRWFLDDSQVLIADKGRQTGFSRTTSLKAVFECLKGQNVYYTSFNKDTTENFIRYCTQAAQSLNLIFKHRVSKEVVNSDGCLVHRLKLNNNCSITALAGNAVNLRDKAGIIIIDEAAFRDNLEQIMDAASAILIWGGKLWIFSTHFGVDNYFNYLLTEAQNRGYSQHSIPFKKAVREGIFKRICLKLGKVWSEENEREWVSEIYKKYGVGADQELDCIPSEDAGLGLFKNFKFVDFNYPSLPVMQTRSWDLAATEKNGCFTVGSLISYNYDGTMILESAIYDQWSPVDGDKKILECAQKDGPNTHIIIELEQGSESRHWLPYIQEKLSGYQVEFKRPESSKVSRAVPVANDIFQQKFMFRDTPDNRYLVEQMKKFSEKPKPLVTDLVDSISQGHSYLYNLFNVGMLQ